MDLDIESIGQAGTRLRGPGRWQHRQVGHRKGPLIGEGSRRRVIIAEDHAVGVR